MAALSKEINGTPVGRQHRARVASSILKFFVNRLGYNRAISNRNDKALDVPGPYISPGPRVTIECARTMADLERHSRCLRIDRADG